MSEPRRQRSGVTGRPEGQWARLARMIAICLCAGVIINVAVAWGLAAWLPHYKLVERVDSRLGSGDVPRGTMVVCYSYSRAGMERRKWSLLSFGDPYVTPPNRTLNMRVTSRLRSESSGDLSRPSDWGGHRDYWIALKLDGTQVIEDARGWPCLALWCAFAEGAQRTSVSGAFPISAPATEVSEFRALPYRPIWRGFIANTAVYAGSIFVLWMLLLRSRELHRLRHGRCPCCAYDLRFDLASGCPECGWRRIGQGPRDEKGLA